MSGFLPICIFYDHHPYTVGKQLVHYYNFRLAIDFLWISTPLCTCSHSFPKLRLREPLHAKGSDVRRWSPRKPHQSAIANSSAFAPGYAASSQSLTQPLAQSGFTKTGPFHGLRRYPTHKEGPQHYKKKVGTRHQSLLLNEWPQGCFCSKNCRLFDHWLRLQNSPARLKPFPLKIPAYQLLPPRWL